MIETTNVYEYRPAEKELRKRYGSKRTGTVYISANSHLETLVIIQELYKQNGLVCSVTIQDISRTSWISKIMKDVF